ncbi:hypothetical protein KGY73_02770 [bacterium]|nr:hypothetical protein [bacterium]
MKFLKPPSLFLILVLVFFSCAPGPNELEKTPDEEGMVAGFWKGIWHGLIAPITFVIYVFYRNIHFYEVHNNGFWYNFGFIMGAGLFLSGGILGHSGKKRHN